MSKNIVIESKRGRPVSIKWSSVVHKWRGHMDKEIADFLGCTQPMVFQKRTKLMREYAEANPKKPNYYKCSRPKYSRSNKPVVAAKAKAKS